MSVVMYEVYLLRIEVRHFINVDDLRTTEVTNTISTCQNKSVIISLASVPDEFLLR
jgi:hypothetical protein